MPQQRSYDPSEFVPGSSVLEQSSKQSEIHYDPSDFVDENASATPPAPKPNDPTKPGYVLLEAAQTAHDQAAKVLQGAGNFITGIPSAILNNAKAFTDYNEGTIPIAPGVNIPAKPFYDLARSIPGIASSAITFAAPTLKTAYGLAPPPQSKEWSDAAEAGGGITTGLLMAKAPEYLKAATENPKVQAAAAKVKSYIPEKLNYRQHLGGGPDQPIMFANPVDKLRTSLGVKGMTDEELLQAGNELHQAESTGGPTTHVDKAIDGTDQRVTFHNEENAKLLRPYNKQPVPGSRAATMNSEIASIPDTIRLMDSGRYAQLVKEIQTEHLGKPDFTVEELNNTRVSANKQLRNFYKDNPLGQMTKEEQLNQARLKAQGDSARAALYGYLPDQIRGAFQDHNAAIGNISKFQQNLYAAQDTARIQSATPTLSLGRLRQIIGSKGTSLITSPLPSSINASLADAMRSWKGTSAPITPGSPYALNYQQPPKQLGIGTPQLPSPTELPSGGSSSTVTRGLPYQPGYTGPYRQLGSGTILPPPSASEPFAYNGPGASPTELHSSGVTRGASAVRDPNLIQPRSPSSFSTTSGITPPPSMQAPSGVSSSVASEAQLSGSPRPFGKLRFSHTEYHGGHTLQVWVDEVGRYFAQ